MNVNGSIENEPSFGPALESKFEDMPDVKQQLDELYSEIREENGMAEDLATEEVDEAISQEVEKMSDREMLKQTEEMNEGTLDFLDDRIENAPDKKERKRAKLQKDIYEDTLDFLDDVKDWVDEEKPEKVQKRTLKFLDEIMKRMKKEGLEDEEVSAAASELEDFINANISVYEETVGDPHVILEGTSALLELIPLVSGPKMLAESVVGKTMGGRKLSVPGRFWHATWAGIWTVIDVAGLVVAAAAAPETFGGGAVAVEGGVLAAKGAKVAKTTKMAVGLLRMTKTGGKASKAILKASEFVVRHPKLAKSVMRVEKYGDKAVKLSRVKGAAKLAAKVPKAVARMRIFKNVRKERMELLSSLDDIFSVASQGVKSAK